MCRIGIDDLSKVISYYQSRIEKEEKKDDNGGDVPPKQDSVIKEQFKDLVYLSKDLGGTLTLLTFVSSLVESDYLTDNYVGLETLSGNLKTNLQRGLVPTDLQKRVDHFGTNRKDPPERTPYWTFFIGAIDDFMLKLLLVCACIDIGFEVGFAKDAEERSTGKHLED